MNNSMAIKNRRLNLFGVAMLFIIMVFSVLAMHANAASSSFEYSGTNVNGKNNGEFHTLSTGTAYLSVNSHSGPTADVKLYRQVSLWFDPSYGDVYVTANKTYTFPDHIDVSSGSYYLVVSAASNVNGSGTLHN